MTALSFAPELRANAWLNTDAPRSLSDFRGKIVVMHAFQMLCPGCVSHGLPQANEINHLFPADQVQVIGLHSVFEHHEAMNVNALRAFVHEYRIDYPIAVDQPARVGPIPLTMQSYKLSGTPSLVIIDQSGQIQLNHFGRLDSMRVGNIIGQLLQKDIPPQTQASAQKPNAKPQTQCDESICSANVSPPFDKGRT